jgi:calcineurin-like phosphoesterase
VSAVIGSHTHVQTADERILPGGTAYLTDAGMTGGYDSVIGISIEAPIAKFLSGLPKQFRPAIGAPRLCGVVVEIDERTGRSTSILRIQREP